MASIEKVAVIGSGVMGAAIAAHFANANIPVMLLDIAPKGADDPNELVNAALARFKKEKPEPLVHKNRFKLIQTGNLNDDIQKLGEVDWIVEAIIEKIEIKQDLYKKIEAVRKKDCIISSNTSTLPLENLMEPMSKGFKEHFLITHFFNPPRYMYLLELVAGQNTKSSIVDLVAELADKKLGKGVVHCKDTPGFIANRIGSYWMQLAMTEAINQGLTVEEADAAMSRPIGVPKTGVFGLMDLVGIDLIPLIAGSLVANLPKEDAFAQVFEQPDIVKKMIEDGYTGRKGKGGFYRLKTEGEKKIKEVVDLKDGSYSPALRPKIESVKNARKSLQGFVTSEDKVGKYAWSVLSKLLHYTASLVPEIADDIRSVDNAMKWGYNWKYGPFELIDRLGDDEVSGPKWLAQQFKTEGLDVPAILKEIGDQPFYKQEEKAPSYFTIGGKYTAITTPKDAYKLADITRNQKPVIKNGSASLWDIGDGIACLEFTSKMNSLDPMTLEMVNTSVDKVEESFKGLVIANDEDNFSVGANIGVLLFAANVAAWKMIEEIIAQGQDSYMRLKYAPFPVVSALSGMALGGGCEIALHSDGIQAHMETYTGLVEVGVGIVPGWGGCKEMLIRAIADKNAKDEQRSGIAQFFGSFGPIQTLLTMPYLSEVFQNIGMAKVSTSAEKARDLGILRPSDRISMNRNRLLPDAKAFCQELTKDYVIPEPPTIRLPGKTAKAAFSMAVKGLVKSGKATPHDEVVSDALGRVISGGATDMSKELTEQDLLQLERDAFSELVRHPGTLARIEHMLETGKPLRN